MKGTNAAAMTFLVVAFGLVGCEPLVLNEGEVANSDVTGTWLYVDTSGARSTWTLDQAEDATIAGTGTASETIKGSVSVDWIHMTLTYSTNVTTSLSGTVSESTMAGTFTNSASESGAWTAYRTR